MYTHLGVGSWRILMAACASEEKKPSANARRMGIARQLPPEKMRSVGEGLNSWATAGAPSSALAPSSDVSVKYTTRLARRSQVSDCARHLVLWNLRQVMMPTTTSAIVREERLPGCASSDSSKSSATCAPYAGACGVAGVLANDPSSRTGTL